MVKKGRPEKLTPRLKEIVAEILKNHPKRKPKVIEEDLRHILLKDEETMKESLRALTLQKVKRK